MHRILKQLSFDNPEIVTQRDLEFFCDHVEEKTGIKISLSTAKRLLHAQFTKLPQVATLNAIAQCLGHENWQSFKQQQKMITEKVVEESLVATKGKISIIKKFNKRKTITLTAVIAVMFFLIAFVNRSINKKPNFETASFNAQKTTANNIPNTVVFHYNVDKVNADSFFIQQSWDRNRRVRVYKNQHTLTDIYYEPGYHTAKLIADNKIIKTFDVSIPTDRWFFYAKQTLSGIPEYIEKSSQDVAQSLALTKEDLVRNNIDTRNEKHFIASYFPTKMEIASDDYVFKTRIKRNAVRNDFCPYIMLEIFCQKNFMYFKSMKPGCSSNSSVQFGEHILSGKNFDLSPLATNVDEWQDFEVVVKNRRVQISINGKKAFETDYKESSGLLTGLGFISNGLCEVQMTELKSGDGKLFYSFKKSVP